jgi:hypothetical protein
MERHRHCVEKRSLPDIAPLTNLTANIKVIQMALRIVIAGDLIEIIYQEMRPK